MRTKLDKYEMVTTTIESGVVMVIDAGTPEEAEKLLNMIKNTSRAELEEAINNLTMQVGVFATAIKEGLKIIGYPDEWLVTTLDRLVIIYSKVGDRCGKKKEDY